MKRSFAYLALGAGALLLGLLLCGCQTQQPPPGWQSPPVKYSKATPPIPYSVPVFDWNIADYEPPNKVRIEWDYEATNMANIVFRVYASYTPHWDSNWTGWWVLGETTSLSFTNNLIGDARFFTITASNTLTGLESDPARRE